MYRYSSSILIMLVFVSVYVLAISSYTYVSSLGTVDLWQKKQPNAERHKRSVDLAADPWTELIAVNYCCAKGQQLNEKLECENFNGTDDDELKGFFAFDNVVTGDNLDHGFVNLSRLSANFEYNRSCSIDDLLVVTWPPTNSTYYYVSQSDGSLLELDDERQTIRSRYSTRSYCLDTMHANGTMVTLLCPCVENACIKKCCPRGDYFNTMLKKCQHSIADIPSYQPDIYYITEQNASNNPYHIQYGSPKCQGSDIKEADSIYIQDNGYLMLYVEDKQVFNFYNKEKYCVDIFSDGHPNASYVSGFHCPNEAQIVFDKNSSSVKFVKQIEEEEESTTISLGTPSIAQMVSKIQTVPPNVVVEESTTISLDAPSIAQKVAKIQTAQPNVVVEESTTISLGAPSIAQKVAKIQTVQPNVVDKSSAEDVESFYSVWVIFTITVIIFLI